MQIMTHLDLTLMTFFSEDKSSQEEHSLSPSNPPSNVIFQDNSSSNDSGSQKLINLILLIEHVIILRMTYQSIIIPVIDKPKSSIFWDINHEKIFDSSYHNTKFLAPGLSLKISWSIQILKSEQKFLSWILHLNILLQH